MFPLVFGLIMSVATAFSQMVHCLSRIYKASLIWNCSASKMSGKVNSTSDKHSSISTRSHCAVTACLPVYLGRAVELSLESRRTQPIFTRCAQIVESGLISASLPCTWFDVEIRCRFSRQLVVLALLNVLHTNCDYIAIRKLRTSRLSQLFNLRPSPC